MATIHLTRGHNLKLAGQPNKEIFDRALLWGSLNLYLSDKKFSKVEQEVFIKRFGKEKAGKAISLLKVSNKEMLEKKVEASFTEAAILLKTDKAVHVTCEFCGKTYEFDEQDISNLKKVVPLVH